MEIYAEISHKTLQEIEGLGNDFILPPGVQMHRKQGSRACYFECDENTKDDLIGFLDDNRISWQAIPDEREIKNQKDRRENEKQKEFKKKSGMRELPDSMHDEPKVSKRKSGLKEFKDRWNLNEDN